MTGNFSGQIPPPALLMPASVWTRKDIQSFKDSVKHCQENVIKIGSLATATVSSLQTFIGVSLHGLKPTSLQFNENK